MMTILHLYIFLDSFVVNFCGSTRFEPMYGKCDVVFVCFIEGGDVF